MQAFLALDADVVAGLLDVPDSVARRLRREGRHLASRLGAEFLEPEEGAPNRFMTPAPAPAAPRVSTPPAGAPVATAPVAADGPASSEPRLDRTERNILGEVLERWRASGDDQGEVAVADSEVEEREELSTEPAGLALAELRGFSETARRRLEAAGYATAEAVVDAPSLELAQALGQSFADVRRLQFLARRGLDSARALGENDDAPRLEPTPAHDPAPPSVRVPQPSDEVPAPVVAQPRPDPGPGSTFIHPEVRPLFAPGFDRVLDSVSKPPVARTQELPETPVYELPKPPQASRIVNTRLESPEDLVRSRPAFASAAYSTAPVIRSSEPEVPVPEAPPESLGARPEEPQGPAPSESSGPERSERHGAAEPAPRAPMPPMTPGEAPEASRGPTVLNWDFVIPAARPAVPERPAAPAREWAHDQEAGGPFA